METHLGLFTATPPKKRYLKIHNLRECCSIKNVSIILYLYIYTQLYNILWNQINIHFYKTIFSIDLKMQAVGVCILSPYGRGNVQPSLVLQKDIDLF